MSETWHTKYLWRNPKRRGGKICIRGTRIALLDVFGFMGTKNVEFEYPDLTEEQIEAAMNAIEHILEHDEGGPIR